MSKKIMIINWKFNQNLKTEEPKVYYCFEAEDCRVITCNFGSKKINDFGLLLEDNSEKYVNDEVIIFLHLGEENGIKNNSIKYKSNKIKKVKIVEFWGGAETGHRIYYSEVKKYNYKGLLQGVQLSENAMVGEKVKKEHFDFVWDWYWNKLDLEYQKENIINLWLPLAIDIQGLKDDNKNHLDDYFEEIKKNVTAYTDDEFVNSWEILKDAMLDEAKEFVNHDLPFHIIKSLKQGNTSSESFYKDYIENKKGTDFFPSWLHEAISIIDKKIGFAQEQNSSS